MRTRRRATPRQSIAWLRPLALAALVGGLPKPAPRLAAQQRFLRPAEVNALPSKPADRRIAYGPDSVQFADLRIPAGPGPHPVAIVVHGGCWVRAFATLQNTAALADALRDQGIASWNVEYRRIDHPGGGWPGTYRDVGAAADQLRLIAEEHHLDLSRVIALGHSAGGHLALWLAARPRLAPGAELATPAPLRLRGAISLGGPGDLAAFEPFDQEPCGRDVIAGLMGGKPAEVPGRYAQGSPAELLPLGVPQILVTGAEDRVVAARFGDAYAEAARSAGDSVQHLVVGEAAHHEYNAPGSPAWPAVLGAVRRLLGLEAP